MIYGLYAKTPEDEEEGCPRCDAFGNKVAELHYTVVALEDNRRFWLNKNNILGPGFFESLVRMFEIFYLFENFFKQTIVLFQDPILSAFGTDKFTGIPSTEKITLAKDEFPISLPTMYTIFDSIPTSDCSQFGYKTGTLIRGLYREVVPADS